MMPGQAVVSVCSARAALAGNPSDGYGGAVVAIPIDELRAMASAEPSDRFTIDANDPDMHALLRATADSFAELGGELPSVTLSASTAIPRSVGLAGSSALIIAALRALAATAGRRWDTLELAQLALTIEQHRLGIEAGLQDRLVQAAGVPLAMTFDPVEFTPLASPAELPLLVAWAPKTAATSDTVHRSLRRRFDGGDGAVIAAMEALTVQARLAHRAIEAGRIDLLGDAMNRTLAIRLTIVDVDDDQRAMFELAQRNGLAVNSAGSGGSLVALAHDHDRLVAARRALDRAGHPTLLVNEP